MSDPRGALTGLSSWRGTYDVYDDHLYCPTDDKHSAQCWCIREHELQMRPDEEKREFPGGLCRDHDMHGDPL